MENAAKALLMAAGILIGVIVLSIFAYEFMVIADTGEQYGKEIRQREIDEFNSQFEAYAYEYTYGDSTNQTPRRLKAQEVATLLYLVSDWNKNNESDKITVNLPGLIKSNYGTIDNFKYEKFLSDKSIEKNETETSYAVFTCSLGKNDTNARIRKITITEIGKIVIDSDGTETFKRT